MKISVYPALFIVSYLLINKVKNIIEPGDIFNVLRV